MHIIVGVEDEKGISKAMFPLEKWLSLTSERDQAAMLMAMASQLLDKLLELAEQAESTPAPLVANTSTEIN